MQNIVNALVCYHVSALALPDEMCSGRKQNELLKYKSQ